MVIPAYNAAWCLPRCLKSVFAQTLKPAEVIVVDDGSTDNTAALAAEMGAIVISQANRGIADARNAGVRKASGIWVALLDADDLWAPEKLERQVALIRPKTVLVYTGTRIFDEDGVRGVRPAVNPVDARKILRYCNPITPSTVLVRRADVLQIGGFRKGLNACEDWGLWFRMRPLGEFEAVTEPLTDYYVYRKSLSADPDIMLHAAKIIIDTTLTADLHGFQRWAWKRRILAVQLNSAGLIARDNGLKGDLRFMFKSICIWPSPFWQPRRYVLFAVSLRNLLHARR